MQFRYWLLLSSFLFVTSSWGQETDLEYELYRTRIAASEAFLQLNKISIAQSYLEACQPKFRDLEWYFLKAHLDQSDRTIRSDSGTIWSAMAFHPVRHMLALAGSDGQISLFHWPDMQLLRQLNGHQESVSSLDFSPDGKQLISGGRDHQVICWEVDQGSQLWHNDRSFSRGIYQVRYSEDQAKVGVVTWELLDRQPPVSGFAMVLDASDGHELLKAEIDAHPAATVDFYLPEHQMLVGSWGEIAYGFQVDSGDLQWKYDLSDPAEYNAFHSMALSPDGKYLVLGSTDHRIHILDRATSQLIRRIEPWEGHSKTIKALAFSPDGRYLASAGEDQTILIWDATNWSKTNALIGHQATVIGLTWADEGNTIISITNDGECKSWNVKNPFLTTYEVCNYGPWQVPVGSDKTIFAAPCSDKRLVTYDIRKGQRVDSLGPFSGISAVISGDDRFLVSAGFDGIVRKWDLVSGSLVQQLEGHSTRVDGVAFLDASGQVLSVGDTTLRIWNQTENQCDRIIRLPAPPFRILLDPSQRIAWISMGANVVGYSTETWQPVQSLSCLEDIQEMTISPDGNWMAVYAGKNIEIWDSKTGVRNYVLSGHEGIGYAVGFSPDSRYLISGSYDQTFKLWNLERGVCTLTFHGYEEVIYSSQFLSERELFLGTSQGRMRYYDFRE